MSDDKIQPTKSQLTCIMTTAAEKLSKEATHKYFLLVRRAEQSICQEVDRTCKNFLQVQMPG